MRLVRPLVVVGSLLASLVLVGAPAIASPNATPDAKPTIASVRKQLDDLARKNSQIVDKYDGAVTRVQQRAAAATTAAQASVLAQHHYSESHRQLVQLMQAQYMGSDLGAAGALLDSKSSGNYLDRLDLINIDSMQTAQVVKTTTKDRVTAKTAARTAATLLDSAKAERTALGRQKTDVEKQIGKYQGLLATLTAQQRAAYLRAQKAKAAQARAAAAAVTSAATTNATDTSGTTGATTGTHDKKHTKTSAPNFKITGAPSARALKAVQFAIAQIGKPYVFAADGPGSYDCSGLTMASWRAAGVSLPHQASAQYNHGHHVSVNQLLPGDLVFFYQPIGHVSMYIGNGTLVSAPQTGEDVKFVKLSSTMGDFTGATRIG